MKLLSQLFTSLVLAVPLISAACTDSANGFASLNGGTTGGTGGQVVTVSTQADLAKYAGTAGKYIIKIAGKITITPKGTEIPVTSDKTIIGTSKSAELYQGGLNVNGQKNIIIRNLKIGKRPDASI